MTIQDKLAILYLRRNKLEANGKNFKSPGVLRKVNRQIRNLNDKVGALDH